MPLQRSAAAAAKAAAAAAKKRRFPLPRLVIRPEFRVLQREKKRTDELIEASYQHLATQYRQGHFHDGYFLERVCQLVEPKPDDPTWIRIQRRRKFRLFQNYSVSIAGFVMFGYCAIEDFTEWVKGKGSE